eukprot:SAG31_NODE_2579_length_5438_cov_17.092527_6_plen_46_part_01
MAAESVGTGGGGRKLPLPARPAAGLYLSPRRAARRPAPAAVPMLDR